MLRDAGKWQKSSYEDLLILPLCDLGCKMKHKIKVYKCWYPERRSIMKSKKRVFACGMLAACIWSASVVNAAEARFGVKDCNASLELKKDHAVCGIFEGGTPVRPITPKRIDGVYTIWDIEGNTSKLPLKKSIQEGQLNLVVYATAHYISKYAQMPYYLNDMYIDTISAVY